ncbi:response regulator [Myxosarcina sp. GI1]|uniref:hybrid sensor histidine kinase/response regulator n=1 Tax=Myxosarcina sp. GI1 TaxID=1541065 RepID=UPI00055FCB75|nr:response regulator [Myxosarcina sp. GI1]
MKLPQLSLTTKIANYFLLLALITVGVVGGVAYFRARKALQQAAFDRLSVAATLKEEEITRWFEDQQRDFLLFTQMPDVAANLNVLLDSNSETEKKTAYEVLTRYLKQVKQIKPSLREVFVLDRSNKIVLSTDKQREGNYEILANITYVEKVETGTDFAPIFYVSPITRKPAITLAKPLKDRQGMILVDLDLERIDRIVREKTGLGTSGEAYLVGSLISKNSFIAGKSSEPISTLSGGISSAGIDAAMSGMSGYGLYRNYQKSSVLGVYRWLNEQDIALLVEIDQAEAFYPARQLASAIILVGLISVLGLLVGVNWLSHQLNLSRQELERSSRQLQIKAREAESANRAKSLFLANMSHELRTPLNAILGFSQLLARDNTTISATQKEYLDIINRSGEHLLNLINDILEMSKIEAGKTTLNLETFDLHLLLQTIRDMFQIRAAAKQLWFEFVLAPNLPQYVISDPRKLRQLLINLLSNAVKFTESGGVTLLATVGNFDQTKLISKQAKLCFEISDTGTGIASKELDSLFNPFVQTLSGSQAEEGTGLGLAICRQFVELMGGKIWVESTLGAGSTFGFALIVQPVEPPQQENAYERVKKIAPGQTQYRIAVVDDKQTNRQVLVELLQSVGFEVRTASNGVEAIELWQQWQPHFIWMDMRMPVMDGYKATEQIRKANGKEVTIVAITASAFEEQKGKVLQAGCDDFVRKPFSERVIFDKLTQYLGVKFVYESDEVIVSRTEPANESVDVDELKTLPAELLRELHQAAIAVDAEQITQLIESIPASHQHIAQAITAMTRNYDFDEIVNLTKASSNS